MFNAMALRAETNENGAGWKAQESCPYPNWAGRYKGRNL